MTHYEDGFIKGSKDERKRIKKKLEELIKDMDPEFKRKVEDILEWRY